MTSTGTGPTHRGIRRGWIGTLCLTGALLGGCHRSPSAAVEAAPAADAKPVAAAKAAPQETAAGVTLTPAQIEKLGIVTQTMRSVDFQGETAGYGVVLAHETIAQAAAELTTARATAQQSQSALMRARRLAGTPGAVSADVEETAARQAAVDSAALTLTVQRMSSSLGMDPPWKAGDGSATLQELAAGRIKLVRVTFPLGALPGGIPRSLRATHIGGANSDKGWTMVRIWDAPADANVPGRSFFALLKGSDAGEGERLMVWAPAGEPAAGVVVPAAAAVLSDGKFWCYVEKPAGTFTRAQIDTARPVAEGYFVTGTVAAGDAVVVAAAGRLLARESGSAAEAD